MKIVRLIISNFRGIKYLDWTVNGKLLCLVGPCDSTKTTILDAIELVLTPRRNVIFDDSDFYNADTDKSITIECTASDIPIELLTDGKFGYLIRGWNEKGIIDEPQGEDLPVLTFKFCVDKTLEPSWLIINDRCPEGKRISAYDRAKLGVSRIKDYTDYHFSWGQGSLLTKLMDEKDDIYSVLASARRQAKASLNPDEIPLLKKSAQSAENIGNKIGVSARTNSGFLPHLDLKNVNIGASIITLHDGPVPLRQAGLGTSRLLSIGLQQEAVRKGGISLIDEIEHGLEPYRIRRLLHVVKTGIENKQSENLTELELNQTFFTTHSPIALRELDPAEIRIVRSEKGNTVVRRPNDCLRPLFRRNPDAFFGRKVIVCEGKTEIGFCRAIDTCWSESGQPFAFVGAVLADGGGNNNGPLAATYFSELGYDTAFLGDSDVKLNPDEAELRRLGIRVFLWDEEMSIEERVASDLPWKGFIKMVNLACENKGHEHVRSKMAAAFGKLPMDVSLDPNDWKQYCNEAELRSTFARTAKSQRAEWFKRVDQGEQLGLLVYNYWRDIHDKPLGNGITSLLRWVND